MRFNIIGLKGAGQRAISIEMPHWPRIHECILDEDGRRHYVGRVEHQLREHCYAARDGGTVETTVFVNYHGDE